MERQEGETYMAWWVRNNRDRYNQLIRNYRDKHREELNAYYRAYYKKKRVECPEFRRKQADQARKYNQTEEAKQKNKDRANRNYHERPEVREKRLQQMKDKYKNDPEYRMKRAEYCKEYNKKKKEQGETKPKRKYEKVLPIISNE